MNQAALHSSEVLARFDAEAEETAEVQEDGAEQRRIALRSGRNISDRPYGEKTEIDDSMSITASGALVKFKSDANPVDYAEDQGSSRDTMQHQSPPRRPLQYPASSITAPGMDALGQLATMQAKLNQRLGPEYISTRQGPGGGKLSYIEGWKAIDLANEVFGFNGWSSTIVRMDVDFLDEMEGKKYNVGVSVVMRITLRDGTFHEDIGYGHCENVKMKHMALEKARKEASTDGLKRALRTFGRMLGNCLYDKKFMDTASKMKAAVPTYDLTELKRTSAASLPQQGQSAPAPPAAAPTTRPAQAVPQRRTSSVQHKQAPQAPVQQQQQQSLSSARQQPPLAHSTNTADPAPAKLIQQASPPTSAPQTKEARLREERKAMAAAKQAELRLRKEKEAAAKQEASSSNDQTGNTSRPLHVSLGDGQAKLVPPTVRGRRHSFEDELENADDYDLALMAAGLDDGADLLDEVAHRGPIPVAKAFSPSSANDSGIGIVDVFSQRQSRMQQKGVISTTSPAAVAKGRFNDSSSPLYAANRNEGNRLPSSSPKVQIPIVKGRRLSLVGNGPAKSTNITRSSQELPSSQRSRGNRPLVQNGRSTPGPAAKRSGAGAYNDTQFKRPRY